MSSEHVKSNRASGANVPLAALRAFEAAARTGAFATAAADIGLSASAVSHHIKDLEGLLGAQLFERRHRAVVLTTAGENLAKQLVPAFGQIYSAYRRAQGRPKQLRMSAAPLFASRYLLLDIEAFSALSPGTELSLESSLDRADYLRGEFDLAGRFGPQPKDGWLSQKLAEPELVIVASPAWCEARQGQSPAYMVTHGARLTLSRQPRSWSNVFRAMGIEGQGPEVLFESLEGLIHAAEQGVGLGIVPQLTCADRVQAGALRLVSPEGFESPWAYWLLADPTKVSQRQLGRIAGWIARKIDADPERRLSAP